MQKYFIFTVLIFFSCYSPNRAQERQWTLLRKSTSGVIAVDPTNSDNIYIRGVLYTKDGGMTWQAPGIGFRIADAKAVIIDPNNPETIYVGGRNLVVGIMKSTDGGMTWTNSDSGIVADHHGFTIVDMALDSKRNILYAADFSIFGGIYRSTDEGQYWEIVAQYVYDLNFGFYDLFVDESDGAVYAGTSNGVWKSTDQAETWTQISKGLPIEFEQSGSHFTVYNIVKATDKGTMYCTLRINGIYKSYDAGQNWFSVNNELTENISFTSGIVASELDTNVVYTGNVGDVLDNRPGGIIYSHDGGQNWQRRNTGLPEISLTEVRVFNLFLDNMSNTLYGTFALSFPDSTCYDLYKLSSATPTSVETIKSDQALSDYYLFQNYPNPFNAETVIRYRIEKQSPVQLTVYDITGKEVKQFSYQSQAPGEYRVRWNGQDEKGGDAASGVYFIQLRTGSFMLTRKLLLIR